MIKFELNCLYFSDVSHPRLLKIVSSFDEAVSLCNTKPLYDEIDSVWVMGGATIYKVKFCFIVICHGD